MGITTWIKETLIRGPGVTMALDSISNFAASLSGQSPTVRSCEYLLLGINDLARGEITQDQAKSLIMSGLPELLPLESIAQFSTSELGKKTIVVGVQSILSGVLGLAVGVDNREEAQRQIGAGLDLILFAESPAEPPTPPAQ